ncbi:MAG: amidohydrolase family protein [Pirellulaceae bacterium]|nr:amidohydrolase family protein [Pirellulaceae bacterium]
MRGTEAFRARWVFPGDQSPVKNGVVRVANGRIATVGVYTSGEAVIDLGNVALLPGFVNAHTHLEFSLLQQPLGRAGMPFAEWIGEVVAFRRRLAAEGTDLAGYARQTTAAGLRESEDAGVAAIGEIAATQWPADCFSSGDKIGGTVFLELLGLAPERIDPLLAAARDHVNAGSQAHFRRGLSPHAPYTVHPDLLRRVCQLSAEKQIPLAMHLAESTDELELLRSHSGLLVERLKELGAWYPGSLPRGLRPLNYLERLAAAHQVLVIHGNFLVREEMEFVAARRDKMSVVYCPRTQAYFPQGAYPLAEMLACGVRVAVGTDSRASNPDLSILSELRHIARHHPSVPPEEVLKMGTLHGAETLGIADELGSLAPGKRAAFVVVPLPNAGDDPYEILFTKETSNALPLLPQAR